MTRTSARKPAVAAPVAAADLLALAGRAEAAGQRHLSLALYALGGRLAPSAPHDIDPDEDGEPVESAAGRGLAIAARLGRPAPSGPQKALFS